MIAIWKNNEKKQKKLTVFVRKNFNFRRFFARTRGAFRAQSNMCNEQLTV